MMYMPDRIPVDYEGIAEAESQREVDSLKARIERLRRVVREEWLFQPGDEDEEIEDFYPYLEPGDMADSL